jgi:hypothetical protein
VTSSHPVSAIVALRRVYTLFFFYFLLLAKVEHFIKILELFYFISYQGYCIGLIIIKFVPHKIDDYDE